MRISIRDIMDYAKCPLYYKLKNIDCLPEEKKIDEYFKDYFKLALYFFYFSIIEKKPKSFDLMMKRWGELWFSNDMLSMFPEDELGKKSNEAVGLMNRFINKYGNDNIIPVAVNMQYEAIFQGSENLHVTGEIDLVKIVNDRTARRETILNQFSLTKHPLDSFMLKNNLPLAVASFAFRSNFKASEDKIVIQNIRCAEDGVTTMIGSDYARAERAIRNIVKGIKEGVFYPNPSPLNCPSCPYRAYCLNSKSINMGVLTNVRN